jgi:hypothetical protein
MRFFFRYEITLGITVFKNIFRNRKLQQQNNFNNKKQQLLKQIAFLKLNKIK